jgi:Zn-dependent M28 family amino/carboxypeptidase
VPDPVDRVPDHEFYPPPTRRRRKPEDLVSVAKSPAAARAARDESFPVANQVAESKLRQSVEALAAFPTRHTASAHLPDVAKWIEDQFRGLGYTAVSTFPYTRQGVALNLMNVVCRKPGTSATAPVRLVCAHFDCIMEQHSNSTARAPGANDNGSGIAVLLELARLLEPLALEDAVEFLATSGEEQGLWGATAYAAHVQSNGTNLKFVLNLDEVGFPNPGRDVILERDLGNVVPTNDLPSQQLAAAVAQLATDELSIPIKLGPIERSDYMPFERRGYVAIGLYESGDYSEFYHTSRDTPDRVDFAYVADVTRVALLALVR